MELISKTFADVIELDIDIDDLSWKQLDYITGLGMEEVYRKPYPDDRPDWTHARDPGLVHGQPDYGAAPKEPEILWPKYHTCGFQAMRLMEAFPPDKLIMPKGIVVELACNRSGTSTVEKSSEFRNCKKALTKAGAKLVLEEGCKLVDNHRRKMKHR